MEKAAGVRVVPLKAGWSDLGGWDAVREFLPADEAGNRTAPGALFVGSRGCSVHRAASPGTQDHPRKPRLVALVGCEGLIVVETPDALLVCREGSGEALRDVVKRLRSAGREDLL